MEEQRLDEADEEESEAEREQPDRRRDGEDGGGEVGALHLLGFAMLGTIPGSFPPSANGARSRSISSIDWYRSAGVRAIAFWMTISSDSGIDGSSERGRGGSSRRRAVSVAVGSFLSNGRRP